MIRTLLVRTRMILFLLALQASSVLNLGAQTAPQTPSSDDEIQSHFAAAQKAQRDKDFAAAEREY